MLWVDRIAKDLHGKAHHIDDMFTPSGYAHMGSLRGPILHHVVYEVLKKRNDGTVFTYVFNDFDPIDGLPPALYEKFSQYFGWPLRLTPSPDPAYKSFAEYFAEDFRRVLESLGMSARYLSSWNMYHEGRFNEVIKEALDSRDKIFSVYKKVAGYKKKAEDWYPFQVICPNCNKLGTTKVTGWDGEKVSYKCEEVLVSWAKGCGNEGAISPFDGNGKFPWKVDWPAHWKVMGVTFEGAGKDHASKGGSYDIAFELCREVFHYPKPYYFPYEFFLFGGKKMASSKGIGLKARDLTSIIPPELARFLIVRIAPQRTLEFDPRGSAVLDLYDDYDRCVDAFYLKKEGKIPEGKKGEVVSDFARIAELSQIRLLPNRQVFLPRFRTLVNLLKSHTDPLSFFEKQKGSPLTSEEKELLEERKHFAEIFLKHNQSQNTEVKKRSLTPEQQTFLKELLNGLEPGMNRDTLQGLVFSLFKKHGFKPRDIFKAFYQVMIGQDAGPRAADVILDAGIEETKKKLKEALFTTSQGEISQEVKRYTPRIYTLLKDAHIFSVDPEVKKKFPSISIGIAILKDVTIKKTDPGLQAEIDAFLKSQESLTTQMINDYPEVQAYRRLYKEMKVDWHSRRPSPEALLRRIATKKGLYTVNTCVDAYNLVVMKHRVSVGAFDYDRIKFPTVLRFAQKGESIELLGDTEPTMYEPTELAYFDKAGGYNIDFNYRDAKRTAVYESTKNILLNVDGIYEVTPEKVEQSLKESVEMILKYCGGKLELAAIS